MIRSESVGRAHSIPFSAGQQHPVGTASRSRCRIELPPSPRCGSGSSVAWTPPASEIGHGWPTVGGGGEERKEVERKGERDDMS